MNFKKWKRVPEKSRNSFFLPQNWQEKLKEIPGNPEQTDSNRKAQNH